MVYSIDTIRFPDEYLTLGEVPMIRLLLASLCVISLVWAGCSDDDDSGNPSSSGYSLSSSMTSAASVASVSSGASSTVSLLSSSAAPASLFISEYVEGYGTGNKYIELFNLSDKAINLAGWSLKRYSEGSTSPTVSLSLSGTIQPGQTFVISRTSPGTWSGTADLTDGGDTMNYNGNDPIALYADSALVDIVGTPGNTSEHIKDMTLVRKPGKAASTTWIADDWYQLPPDTVANLGSHDPVNPMSSSSASSALPVEYPLGSAGNEVYISEYFNGNSSDKFVEIFNAGTGQVSLANYRLVRIDVNSDGTTNFANSWCVQLSGSLYKNAAYLFVNGGCNTNTMQTVAGIEEDTGTSGDVRKKTEHPAAYPYGICFFGGNDPIYLVKDGVVVDALGQAQAANWGDFVSIRKKSGRTGNPVWTSDDWESEIVYIDGPGGGYKEAWPDYTAGWHTP